jgi:O-antigen/teichoic acid export membrane protein
MLIVTPSLSSNRVVFGVYSICISVSIFLSYADLGFLGAGQKYAAEEFARGNLEGERRIVGFSGFILFLVVILLALLFSVLGMFPHLLIPSLSAADINIARALLLILASSSLVTVLLRMAQMIFAIRVEDHIYQRWMILANCLKIASVFWFFRPGVYDVVSYYAFIQTLTLVAACAAFFTIRRRYNYGLAALFHAFRFDRSLFNRTKKLAFNSLFMTLSWILYYECDNFVIGQVLGAERIAIYAVGLTLMSFLRSVLSGFFGPFASRFNHFVGVGDKEGLKTLFFGVVGLFLPVVVFLITVIVLLMNPLVHTWVGPLYAEAVPVATLLICCNLFAFITYPAGILLVAQERVKTLYVMGAFLPVGYWTGVALGFQSWGLAAFGSAKLGAFAITAVVYLGISLKYLDISLLDFIKSTVLRNIPFLVVLVGLALVLRDHLPTEKDKGALLLVIGTGAVLFIVTTLPALVVNPEVRKRLSGLLRKS